MKKLYFLFVILLCLAVLSPIWAVSAGSSEVSSVSTDRTGVSFDMETSGDIVHPTGYYYAHKRLEQIPVTLEAWIYIPAEVYNLEGSIISNYAEIPGDEFFNFAISAYGIPTFWVGKGKGTSYSTLSFAEAKVPADKWTHIALVYGTGIEGKQAFCYINGTLKAKSSPNDYVKMKKGIFENAVCIGGDMRSFNLGGFKGTLGDVKVYADVRSEKEIAADMKNPANNKDNQLIMSFDISAKMQGKHIPDKSGNGYDMYYGEIWLTEEEMQEIRAKDPTEYAYSIAVIPDPQYSTQLYPESLKSIFDYVLENYEEKNMQYVASVGDLTEGNYYVHWDKVKAQTDRLNGIVPYTVLRGNHDTYHDANILDEYYCQPSEYYYKHVHKNGGAFTDETLCNTYLLFEVGNVKYLLLNLDWDVSNEALAWADEVLSAHPDRRVIAVTHGYLDADGTTLDVNDEGSPAVNTGEDIWNKLLRKHANVHMVLCGHIEQDDILLTTAKGDNGNIVYQFLIDTQRPDAWLKGGGFISTLYFSEDGNKVRVECYSNTYKKYFRTASNTISFEVGSEFNRETVEDTTTDFVPTLPPQDDDSSTSTPAFMPNAAGSVIGMQINGETVVSSADYIEKMGYATDDTWTAVSTAVDFVAALKKAGAKIYLTQDVDFKDYTGYLNGGGNIVQIANGVTVDGCGYGMKNVTLSGKTHVYPFWYKGADQLIFKNFNVGREDARVKVSSTNYSYTCAFLYGNTTAAILIDNVKMWADVTAKGDSVAGFFTALNYPQLTIKNSEMNGSVTVNGTGVKGAGGFTTNTWGTTLIENCVNNATITGRACGGIYGAYGGGSIIVRNCVNNGTIYCTTEDEYYSIGTHAALQTPDFVAENVTNTGMITNIVNGKKETYIYASENNPKVFIQMGKNYTLDNKVCNDIRFIVAFAQEDIEKANISSKVVFENGNTANTYDKNISIISSSFKANGNNVFAADGVIFCTITIKGVAKDEWSTCTLTLGEYSWVYTK